VPDGHAAEQSNFHDYPILRINEAPVVDVHILDSGQAPGGLGEPGVPPLAPSICNAIYAVTGKRVRALRVRADELKRA
jgi:isoquinoline 1-oxidoreductase beta subunit